MSAPVTAPAVDPAVPVRPAPHRERTRRDGWYWLRTLAAVLVSLVLLFPLYWMVVVAFSPRDELLGPQLRLWPGRFTGENVERVFSSFPIGQWFVNSVAIGVVVVLITVVMDLMAGYAFAHLRMPGGPVVFLVLVATLALPVQVIMVPAFTLVTDLGLYGTYWAVILPTAANAFGIFLARQFILAIPRELIEAARVDGAGPVRIFRSIVLPLCKPLIAVLVLLTLLSTWNDFAWPLIALKQNSLFTLPIGLLYLQGQFGADYGATMAFALLSVIPMVVLFLLFQRSFVQGFARSGLR